MRRLHHALILAFAALALDAPMAAADGVAYGGASYRVAGPGDRLISTISLVHRPDGQLRARVGTNFTCPEQRGLNLMVKLDGRVAADGQRFVLRRGVGLPGGRVRVTLRGRIADGAVTGTVRTRFTGLGRCPSTPRRFVLRPGGLAAGAVALPGTGAILAGTSSQGIGGVSLPVALRAGKGGRTVMALWQARLQCGRQVVARLNLTPATRVRADGTFVRRERYASRFASGRSSGSAWSSRAAWSRAGRWGRCACG